RAISLDRVDAATPEALPARLDVRRRRADEWWRLRRRCRRCRRRRRAPEQGVATRGAVERHARPGVLETEIDGGREGGARAAVVAERQLVRVPGLHPHLRQARERAG